MPAQNQIRARQAEAEAQPEKRMTLLQRLATVGFGRREEGPAQEAPEAPAPRVPVEAPRPPISPVHAEYAKRQAAAQQGYRPAQGQLDPQGRSPAPPRVTEEDQLEIPAFLRRQAN
jgi:cell division protein FtsZ